MAMPLGTTEGTMVLTAFGRGRQSLQDSVWYSGNLLTFLATGEDTQGGSRYSRPSVEKAMCPLRTSTAGKMKPSISLRAR